MWLFSPAYPSGVGIWKAITPTQTLETGKAMGHRQLGQRNVN